eukprot:129539-Hanusia_phi.AAC.1
MLIPVPSPPELRAEEALHLRKPANSREIGGGDAGCGKEDGWERVGGSSKRGVGVGRQGEKFRTMQAREDERKRMNRVRIRLRLSFSSF